MSKTIVISFSDIRNALKATLAEYWQTYGWSQPVSLVVGPGGKSIFVSGVGEICDQIIGMVLYELVTEQQTDMRNAGQLVLTEKLLVDHKIDERTAHSIAEDLFANLVNTLGEHLPHLTFSDHDGYSYQLKGPDLWIYPKHI
jgi:hypothetical protein